MPKPIWVILSLGLALLVNVLAESILVAQDTIALGTSKEQMTFQGTGTQVINVVWQNCNTDGCTLSGYATRMRDFEPTGEYRFVSTSPRPFKLLATAGIGLFDVDQSARILFTYTSPRGTLSGNAHFGSTVQNAGRIAASLSGTLEVTGGTLASAFASGPALLSLTLAIGKTHLSTLVGSTSWINGAIDASSMLTPPTVCRAGSTILAKLDGTPLPGGAIWFTANFRAGGVRDGTYLAFQGGFVQFSNQGKDQILHVPNAVVTFSSSAGCPSTQYDSGTDTWHTTVPLHGSDEIFLSGFSFPIPTSGLAGGIQQVVWNESFASNTPDLVVDWRWTAEVFRSFSSDYNSLGVTPAFPDACLRNSSGRAGMPENIANLAVGGGSGGARPVAWSTPSTARANCP